MAKSIPEEELPQSAENSDEIGVSGAAVIGGFIVEDERDASLVGQEKYRTYSNLLLNTTVVAASVRYYLNLVTKAGWKFEESEDDKDREYADKVEKIVTSMKTPWSKIIRRAAMYRFYGFSVHEWTPMLNEDGDFGFFDIAVRPQRTVYRWDVDLKGRVKGVWQQDPITSAEYYIPRWKMMYVVDDSMNDSPEGVGIFRHLARPARRLDRYEQLEGYGFESDLRGTPIGRAPLNELNKRLKNGDLTQQEYDRYLAPVRRFLEAHVKSPRLGMLLDSAPYKGADEAATPSNVSQWAIELLRGSPVSLPENAAAIERLNLEMARTMGTEHLLIGGDGKGSMALSTDKSHNFALIVESSLKEVAGSVTKDIIDNLWLLNGWDNKYKPKAQPEPIRFRNPEQITAAILDLARAGAVITNDDPLVNVVRDIMNLPRTKPVEELGLPGAINPLTGLPIEPGVQTDPITGQPILPAQQPGAPGAVPAVPHLPGAGIGVDTKPDGNTLGGALDNITEDLPKGAK